MPSQFRRNTTDFTFGVGECSTSKPPVRLDFGKPRKKRLRKKNTSTVLLILFWGRGLTNQNKNNNQNPGFLSFPPTIHPRILKTRRDTTRGRRRQGSNERPFTRSSPSIWNTREVNCLSDVLDVKGGGCAIYKVGTKSSHKWGLWLLQGNGEITQVYGHGYFRPFYRGL